MQHPIDRKLDELGGCPVSVFCEIHGLVSRTRLTQALQFVPGKSLDRNLEDRLLTLLDEMLALKNASPITPDWSDAPSIREQLAARREVRKLFKDDSVGIRMPLGVE